MLARIDRCYVHELLKPAATAIVCWRNYGRNTNAGNVTTRIIGLVSSAVRRQYQPHSARIVRPKWITSESWKEETKPADQTDYFKLTPLYETFRVLHDMASRAVNYGSEF
jgi:hypothetical protein